MNNREIKYSINLKINNKPFETLHDLYATKEIATPKNSTKALNNSLNKTAKYNLCIPKPPDVANVPIGVAMSRKPLYLVLVPFFSVNKLLLLVKSFFCGLFEYKRKKLIYYRGVIKTIFFDFLLIYFYKKHNNRFEIILSSITIFF